MSRPQKNRYHLSKQIKSQKVKRENKNLYTK